MFFSQNGEKGDLKTKKETQSEPKSTKRSPGDPGPLKRNSNQHNAILVSWGVVFYSQIIHFKKDNLHLPLKIHHSGGEQSLGKTKYIIGNSYTVGKVWASTVGIN